MSDCDSDDSDEFVSQVSQRSMASRDVSKKRTNTQVARAAKAAEKEAAMKEKVQQAEARGRCREKEIAIVADEECTYLQAIHKKFGEKLENKVKLNVLTHRCNSIKGLFRWTHRKFSLGGAGSIGSSGSEVFPYVVIDITPADIIKFLDQSSDGMEFSAFSSAISEYANLLHIQESCPKDSRIVILIIGLEQHFSKQRCRPGAVPYSKMFDNASAVLLCENTIELVSLKNIAEAADYLHGVTRMLMAEPYKYEDDELNTTKRYSKRMKAVEGASAAEKNQHMLNSTWVNMLQCIDGVTEASAQKIASQYRSLKELVTALRDVSKPLKDRQLLLQDLFGGKVKKPKLSRKIYRVFAGETENAPINSDDDRDD